VFDAIFIYDAAEDESHQVTSGYYQDTSPVFRVDGNYLFFLTNRNMEAVYSDLDATWIYPNSAQIAAISLLPETATLLPVKNDEIELEVEVDEGLGEMSNEDAQAELAVDIDFSDIESRLVLLPPEAGNIGQLFPFQDKLAYLRRPNSGSTEESSSLMFYDFQHLRTQFVPDALQNRKTSGKNFPR
jgi:tricorn protease